jgi:hypothetical protein
VLQSRQQEGPEAAFVAAQVSEVVPLQQAGEEALGQVLGILPAAAAAADVGIERVSIRPTELRQRHVRRRRNLAARGKHHGPVGGGEEVVGSVGGVG